MRSTESDICPHCGKNINYEGLAMHLPAGYVLSGTHPYVLGAALGQGGFGITYIALDMITGQRVAIKEFFPTYCSGRTSKTTVSAYPNQEEVYNKGKTRFLDEARTLKSLSDLPYIVNAFDFFEANNTAYLVMEYLEGSSLKEAVLKNGKFPAQKFLRQIRPLMEDIHKMHGRGMIHRDIAPDNIILMPDGQMKLIDFGAARSYLGNKSMTVVVKKGFAPLEQYMSKGCTYATDVYALAATIYYCITGKVPTDSALRQSDGTELAPPSKFGADITPSQEKAIMKALEIQPKARTQSIQEFLVALAQESKAPDPNGWTCPKCGTSNTGKVCSRCKTKKPGPKPVKKLLIAAAVFAVLLVGFFTIHIYSSPSCTKGSVCILCGKKGSESALGHKWKAATCTAPKTCTVCKTTSGTAASHKWKAATCTAPKTCSVCNKKTGSALDHQWKAATCTTPKTCKSCGATSGSYSGHQWKAATYDTPKTCSVCNKKEGNVKGYIGDVDGGFYGEQFYRSYRRTGCYSLDQRIENCRKFTLEHRVTKIDKGSIYGNFEVFVRYGKEEWEWKSLGVVKIKEDRVQLTFELEPGVSFDAIAVVCNASGSYSYSSTYRIYDVQVYED